MKKIIRPDRRTATSFQVVAAPGRTLNVWFQKVNCQSRNPEQKKKNHGARPAQVKQLALCRSIWKSDSFKKSHTLACGSRYVYNNCFKKQRKYKKRKTGPFQVRFHGRWSIWFRLWKHAPPGRERDGVKTKHMRSPWRRDWETSYGWNVQVLSVEVEVHRKKPQVALEEDFFQFPQASR